MNHSSNQTNHKIVSPCTGTCELDETDVCSGCFRSIEEIISWFDSSEQQKKEILANCLLRQRAQN